MAGDMAKVRNETVPLRGDAGVGMAGVALGEAADVEFGAFDNTRRGNAGNGGWVHANGLPGIDCEAIEPVRGTPPLIDWRRGPGYGPRT